MFLRTNSSQRNALWLTGRALIGPMTCPQALGCSLTTFVLNDYSRNSSVSAMLADLNWQSLEERRIIDDLTMFYKINSNSVNISFPAEVSLGFQRTRMSHVCKCMPLLSTVNAYKYSFFPRTIPIWNSFPFSVIHASSVNLFKASIVLSV